MKHSLSEYGCIKGNRQFQEVSTLYSSKMTSVYSGGLVYEYSEEGSGYGLVTISGNQVTKTPDFTALEKEFSQTQSTGDGGYKSNGKPSKCPTRSKTWEVSEFTGDELPSMPSGAQKYMKNGAGKPPGLDGPGSQNAGGISKGTTSGGSGTTSTSASASASSSGAAVALRTGDSMLMPLFACGAVLVFSSLFGASLL